MSSTSQNPVLSAVVCTQDRAEPLRNMLESLCAQTLDRGAFEVVLVDDGSKDGTREVARAFEKRLPIRYSYQRNAGLASARNHGLFTARGELLLFLDDEDLADPRLLESHVRAHRRSPNPEVAILGHTRLAPSIATDPLMHFVTEVGCLLFSYPQMRDGDVLDFTYFWGGRSSCKRALLLERGVFNPLFRFGCEDIELGFRLSARGFKVVYDARAVSTMVRRIGFDGFCGQLRRQGQSRFLFSRQHEDEVVQRWTDVWRAGEEWRNVGSAYEAVLRSGRELDRIVRRRLGEGLSVATTDWALLYRGYWGAFRASKVKGIVEKAREMGCDLVAGGGASSARGAA